MTQRATPDREPVTGNRRSSRDTAISLALAALIILAWLAVHIYSLFFFEITLQSIALLLVLMALNTWLSVGLFIVAHDCMHGIVVPLRPGINGWIGHLCLQLYAGFSFSDMNPKHHLHHRHAGTAGDPDFFDHRPHSFLPWFVNFFREYASLWQYAHIILRFWAYVLVLGATMPNVVLLWALPAILSAAQLFIFGTYLPHRPGHDAFTDRHRSRSNNYSWIVSLLTCFHFGYHHEHHANPRVPWWQLPREHVRSQAPQQP